MLSVWKYSRRAPHTQEPNLAFSDKLPVYSSWNTLSLKLGLSKFSQYLKEYKKLYGPDTSFLNQTEFSQVWVKGTLNLYFCLFNLTCIFFHLKQVYFSYRLCYGNSQWGIMRDQLRGFQLPSQLSVAISLCSGQCTWRATLLALDPKTIGCWIPFSLSSSCWLGVDGNWTTCHFCTGES